MRLREEDQLKNIHNPHQDAITIAGTKIDSRGSFDVIEELQTNLTSITGTDWEAFEAGADRSSNNPQIDIGKAQLNINGTGVGGVLNRVGMHQFTLARWRGNSYNRILIELTRINLTEIEINWEIYFSQSSASLNPLASSSLAIIASSRYS